MTVFALVALAPLFTVLHGSFESEVAGATHGSLAGWRTVWHESRLHRAIVNTVLLTLASQLIAVPAGIGLSWILARTDVPGRRLFELAFWISFFLPALAVVQGWTLALDPHNGFINLWLMRHFDLTSPPMNIDSWGGIVFAHLATTTISAKVMMLTPAFQNMDARLEEAAQMAGDSRFGSFCRITLPLMWPAIAVAALLGVISALESFEIELVLGSPRQIDVYSTVIYAFTRYDPVDYASAFALGVPVIALMIVFAWATRFIGGARSHVTVSGNARSTPIRLGRWRPWVGLMMGCVTLLLTVVPLCFLLMTSVMTRFGFFHLPHPWTTSNWTSVVEDPDFLLALRSTFVIATGSAALTVVLSGALAYLMVRGRRRGKAVLALAAWAPFTVPGVLFSLAALWLVLHSGIDALYGSTISLIVVVSLASVTVGAQLLRTQVAQISADLEEAAWLSGASTLTAVLQILLPICRRALAVVAVIAFVSAARDISHIALLVSSDNQPLSMLQFQFILEGRNEASAVIGVILAVMATAAALIARRVGADPISTR